ncbi:ribosome small subunit-dependent GTPase A [Mycoplasma sp. 6243]|uniref:ribosome small subunit-dependent GTPase A n=1 Tax=Mycoplasma sp. 6243 TaxID=3440865 RepID=UPI003EBFD8A5
MKQIYKIFEAVSGIYKLVNKQQVIKVPAAGKLRFLQKTPVVGDNVIMENNQIVEILDRQNFFIRPKVANVDQIFIFMSIKQPKFSSFLVDKYMAIIEEKQIEPVLCISKIDLDEENARKWANKYQNLGYHVILINNNSPNYLNKIEEITANKYNLFMGQSGVGKTTTLNNIGNFNYQTQEISKALGRGKHTTRTVSIIKIKKGWLIDTPGFSSLDLNLTQIQLAHSYKCFYNWSKLCKFRSCLHQNEAINDCAIKQKLRDGVLPEFRYKNYLKLLSQLNEGK